MIAPTSSGWCQASIQKTLGFRIKFLGYLDSLGRVSSTSQASIRTPCTSTCNATCSPKESSNCLEQFPSCSQLTSRWCSIDGFSCVLPASVFESRERARSYETLLASAYRAFDGGAQANWGVDDDQSSRESSDPAHSCYWRRLVLDTLRCLWPCQGCRKRA